MCCDTVSDTNVIFQRVLQIVALTQSDQVQNRHDDTSTHGEQISKHSNCTVVTISAHWEQVCKRENNYRWNVDNGRHN